MKKNLFMLFVVILTACVFASCSKDDDDNSGAASSLTMNGEAIKVKSIEGEYDPSTSFRAFTFWVNDASVINSGDEYITDSDFRSGNLVVQNIDTSKKVLTLEFKNLKYTNNLKKEVILNGTLTIPYKILE